MARKPLIVDLNEKVTALHEFLCNNNIPGVVQALHISQDNKITPVVAHNILDDAETKNAVYLTTLMARCNGDLDTFTQQLLLLHEKKDLDLSQTIIGKTMMLEPHEE